ncbi:transposase [Streptomyces sp. SAI-229]|uniref:transposase n=1 Tax=Streptomyces sp. SAI-229 TaxID=3377731 RepID=UPI003C7DAE49
MVPAVVGRRVRVRRPYRSDVSDARRALIEPVFTAWRARGTGPGTAARVHDLREIVNAILYVNRTGIPGVPAARLPAVQDRLRSLREVGRRRHHPAGPRPVVRQAPAGPRPQRSADRGRGRRAEREDLGRRRRDRSGHRRVAVGG